jgi:hypothetical protein
MNERQLSPHRAWAAALPIGLAIITALVGVALADRQLAWAQGPPPQAPDQASHVPIVGDFPVAPSDWGDQTPAVGLGPLGYYLVVWTSYRTPNTYSDIYGLRVQENGTLWDRPISVSVTSGFQYGPDLAYDPDSGDFLVVWYDYRSGLPDIYGQLIDGSSWEPIGGNFPICTASGSQYYPRVTYNQDVDEYLVVWQDNRAADGRIYGRRVAQNGALLGSELVISSGSGENKGAPSIDYSATLDRYMVVWADDRGSGADIYGQLLFDTGLPDGSETAICTASGTQDQPEVALDGFTYEWLVLWRDRRNLSTNGSDVRARWLLWDGTPTGVEMIIAGDVGDEEQPALVYNPNEYQFLAAWRDTNVSPVGAIRAVRIDDDHTFDGFRFTISSGDETRTAPALAYHDWGSYGSYLVVWEDYSAGGLGEVFGRIVADNAGLSEARGISKWTEQSDTALAYNPEDDEYLLVFRDARGPDYDIWGRRLDGAGNPLAPDFFIGGGTGYDWVPDVAYSTVADRYLVVWNDGLANDDVWGQMVNRNGSLYGSNFAICTAAGAQSNAAVASSNSARGFLVAWTDGRWGVLDTDIYGRRVNNDGSLGASELAICTHSENQADPAIAFAPSNNNDTDAYLVVWRDERSPTDRDVYGRRVLRTGTLGSEVLIAGAASVNEEYPSVAYNPTDDEFLVVYTYRDGSTQDIYARRVDPATGGAGSALPICTEPSAQYAAVADYSSASGRYLVAWQDSRDGWTRIYGRGVHGNGSPAGPDFRICSDERSKSYVDAAYGSGQDLFLVAWADDRVWWRGDDIYARRIAGGILSYGTFLPVALRQ